MSRKHETQKSQAYRFATARMSKDLYRSLTTWEKHEILELCYASWMQARKNMRKDQPNDR